ncbi:sensor histidine kinase [Sphingobacterium detergens]|uniref:Histidine kinase n=1 Tax=Sphingobacterium detergens TaxID=1145106 RepID=A0A420B6X7_SPHD1|nr:histidine kinase [Sphingobacterium detergens]RKE52422.1 histidine kinase [Sphingobacterium detergens]
MNKVKIALIHFVLWTLYISLYVSLYSYGDNFFSAAYETTVSYVIIASFFYLHSEWLLPVFFERKRYKGYAGMLIVLYTYCIGLKYFFAFIFDPWIFDQESTIKDDPIGKFLIISTLQWLNFAAFSLAFWFTKKYFRDQKKEREKERIKLENSALRAKLNPHFLFNVLDSFRIESEKVLPNLSRAIESLIYIIRSSIIEPGPDGMIPFMREIKAIQCYISIFKKRFPDNNICFSLQIFGGRNYVILPHILREFVENALKYGDYRDPNHRIMIIVKVENDCLYFKANNKKNGNFSEVSTGMGLKNIKKYIKLGYPNNHILKINDTPQYFDVELIIEELNLSTGQNKKSNCYDDEY